MLADPNVGPFSTPASLVFFSPQIVPAAHSRCPCQGFILDQHPINNRIPYSVARKVVVHNPASFVYLIAAALHIREPTPRLRHACAAHRFGRWNDRGEGQSRQVLYQEHDKTC
ncbi:hypothetical protein HBI56_132010 [Parastagonospora nodorum]|nr:hypothetical protein HBH52_164970 [Parastagonospora nodorum]KAH3996764.1 hypothetical protein HBI10_153930 [Parastagonospora nodorum]KAH4029626.1 hypothetical protein HBI09_135740 [Parastagonospora nodorum]KAH4047483.1 hypothetical protein HBH49_165770 [Parastagonospora nodorum]KAH4102679.1 hypothetical protein HBH46_124710 [Parastagonospora nodorum]